MSENAKEPEDVLSLPVVVEADDVHMRYCASLVIDGKPDRRFYGEYRVGESWGDSEQQKQFAIDDLRAKILRRIQETNGK